MIWWEGIRAKGLSYRKIYFSTYARI